MRISHRLRVASPWSNGRERTFLSSLKMPVIRARKPSFLGDCRRKKR